jgi:predicted amidophosphoribosyltransferase
MCFRPAGIDQAINCPECKKKLNLIDGVVPLSCPFCDVEFDGEALKSAAMAAQDESTPLVTPAAPVAPNAPRAPRAPGAPKTPGA